MKRNNYDGNIKDNSEAARMAEDIAVQLLHQIYAGTKFYSVHDDQSLWHYGDIISSDGFYYDAKDDGVIYRTGNVYAEDKKIWNDGKITDGWMGNSKYDYVCIVDLIECNFYVLDFEKLKKIYKNGNAYRPSQHDDNLTWGYCVPLWKCRKYGVLVYEAGFEYDDMDCYDLEPLHIKKK